MHLVRYTFDSFAQVLRDALSIPLIANGDFFTSSDAILFQVMFLEAAEPVEDVAEDDIPATNTCPFDLVLHLGLCRIPTGLIT